MDPKKEKKILNRYFDRAIFFGISVAINGLCLMRSMTIELRIEMLSGLHLLLAISHFSSSLLSLYMFFVALHDLYSPEGYGTNYW